MAVKIYISVDMEGIAGVAAAKHVQPQERDYDRFRRLMTQEANAAVEGALARGAQEVVVSDGHGPMTNILIEELHPEARLLSAATGSWARWTLSIRALGRCFSSATISAKAGEMAS
jgi:D-amino peptidase